MNPTNEQKLIILMLADIAEKLGADNHFDPKLVAKAISYDSAWILPFKYDMTFPNEETPPNVNFVLNVLDMFTFLEDGVAALSDNDSEKLAAAPGQHCQRFIGFDGNNETEYMAIASHLIKDLELFEIFINRKLNSHLPVVDTYLRMYSVFDKIRPNLINRKMDISEIILTVSEGVHPSNR